MTHAERDTDLTRMRVLLVDDNAALRGALRVSLHAFGCAEVIEADTVDRAFDVLDTRPVDLIITDWKMQPRDGIDFVRALRRSQGDGNRPHIPVIMLSAYSSNDRIDQASQAGVDSFLVKPFTAATLAGSLRETLTRHTGPCTRIPMASRH